MSRSKHMSSIDNVNPADSTSFFVGVDVAKLTFDASLAPLGGVPAVFSRLPVSSFEMSKSGVQSFKKWLENELDGGAARGIVIEATGVYSKRFVDSIKEYDLPPVSTINPYYPLSFKRSLGIKDKTDRVDARTLALYGAMRTPAPDREYAADQMKLKELHRLCDDLEKDLGSWRNRLEQTDSKEVRTLVRTAITQMETSLSKARAQIKKLIDANERMKKDVELMRTIPGIGETTAVMLLAELGNMRDWKRDKIVGYCGLYPRRYTSGTSVGRRPRLAKGGGWRIRRGLFMCCLALCRIESRLSNFGKALKERGKSKMCAIGAMMRKLLLIARAVVVSGNPYDPDFRLTSS